MACLSPTLNSFDYGFIVEGRAFHMQVVIFTVLPEGFNLFIEHLYSLGLILTLYESY